MPRTKINKTTKALRKSGDTLDMAPVVREFKAAESMSVDEIKTTIKEISEIESTPDMPERWGNRGPLTIASPGNIVEDPTYIPDVVDLRSGGSRRIANHRVIYGVMHTLTADSMRKFRWCRNDGRKIPLHKRRGFVFSKYKDMFEDTGMFEKGPGDIIQNGDLVLMEVYIDGWEKMRDEKLRFQALLEGGAGDELFAAGQQHGVPTFKDNMKTGTREYYT